jgi:FtsZ-binding cell division protein ZapB
MTFSGLLSKKGDSLWEPGINFPTWKMVNYFRSLTFASGPIYILGKNYPQPVIVRPMEWNLFELLEQKIDRLIAQVQSFSQENQELKRKLAEQSQQVEQAREQMDALEEEKTLLRDKVDGILQKIAKFVD